MTLKRLIMNQNSASSISPRHGPSSCRVITPAVGMLLLIACASVPAPTRALQAAEQAITHAETARVADYASPELNSARHKLAAAHVASQDEDMVLALRLAEQAKADAELAIAKAAAAKASVINEGMRHSNTILKQEMQRNNSGVTP